MPLLAKVAIWVWGIVAALILAWMIFIGYALSKAFPPSNEGKLLPPMERVLWPAPQDAGAKTAPRDVARSFVEDFVGVENPALGPFERRNGQVTVFRRDRDGRRTDRLVAIVSLERLDGGRWFVMGASGENEQLAFWTPGFEETISSPQTVAARRGSDRGSVAMRVHDRFDPQPLAQRTVTAGATRPPQFSTSLTFGPSRTRRGVVVYIARSPAGVLDAFVLVPVRFAAG